MIFIIIGAVLLGIATGLVTDNPLIHNNLDAVNEYVLLLLVFVVGIDLGKNVETWYKLRKMGIKILLAPLIVVAGTLIGAFAISFFVDTSLTETLAISAGFGWYSMSAVLLKKLVSTEVGAIAFLANLFRELLAIFLIPFIVKFFGKFPAMAPGGATSMDTTLPFVSKYAGKEIALIGFISGLTLTFISPFLISLLISLNI
jgi:uncharacterized membrane protein YbjE (DUF340 family)